MLSWRYKNWHKRRVEKFFTISYSWTFVISSPLPSFLPSPHHPILCPVLNPIERSWFMLDALMILTLMKCGRKRPTEYLAISVVNWQHAAPKAKNPMNLYRFWSVAGIFHPKSFNGRSSSSFSLPRTSSMMIICKKNWTLNKACTWPVVTKW